MYRPNPVGAVVAGAAEVAVGGLALGLGLLGRPDPYWNGGYYGAPVYYGGFAPRPHYWHHR